mgnify:CR=1 FL=1
MRKCYEGKNKMKIFKPTIGGHDGSSFRELIDMWGEAGYCEVIKSNKTTGHYSDQTLYPEARPWVNKVGDIMLYDNPILDKLHDNLNWKMALWSNVVHRGENSYPWTFWPKHPKIHAKVVSKGIKKYDDREGTSVFIGRYTTPKRQSLLVEQELWAHAIEFFWLGRDHNANLCTNEAYLEILNNHKFGLCVPGVGPKCLRDMELIGLGTVPIFTPGVSCEYYEPLERNKHFLFANNPTEVKEVIESCTKEKWEYISNQCREWYERNVSPKGSYELTMKIIETHYKK